MSKRILEIEWCENMRGALVRGIRSHLSLRKRHEIMAYAMGCNPPHYPVPALHPIPQRMLRSMELNDVPITDYDLLMAHWYNAIAQARSVQR